jgi:hypothetical protein
MVRTNLNLMGRPAKRILMNYARKNNLSVEEATRKALGLVRTMEKLASEEIDKESAGITPFITFVGVRSPAEPVFVRAVSQAEHGKIPVPPKTPKFRVKNSALRRELSKEQEKESTRFMRFRTIQEIQKQVLKEERGIHKRPITRLEFLRSRAFPFEGATYKYCTAYSTNFLKRVVQALERKELSADTVLFVSHEMREILGRGLRAETPIHLEADQKDREIAQRIAKKIKF